MGKQTDPYVLKIYILNLNQKRKKTKVRCEDGRKLKYAVRVAEAQGFDESWQGQEK